MLNLIKTSPILKSSHFYIIPKPQLPKKQTTMYVFKLKNIILFRKKNKNELTNLPELLHF